MSLLKHLLSLALHAIVFLPCFFIFPACSIVVPFVVWLHPSDYSYLWVEVSFWGGPWSAAFWTLLYSQRSSMKPWLDAGETLCEWRRDHGGVVRTTIRSTSWMIVGFVISCIAELLLLITFMHWDLHGEWFATLLPFCTYSPLALVWWRRKHYV